MAASALLSCTTPSTAFSSTTTRMMNTSVKLSPLSALVTADTAAAAIRISSMGSFSCARNRCSREGFSASFSLLGPCLARRSAASASVRPVGQEPSSSSTSCGLRLYSFSIVYYSFISWFYNLKQKSRTKSETENEPKDNKKLMHGQAMSVHESHSFRTHRALPRRDDGVPRRAKTGAAELLPHSLWGILPAFLPAVNPKKGGFLHHFRGAQGVKILVQRHQCPEALNDILCQFLREHTLVRRGVML